MGLEFVFKNKLFFKNKQVFFLPMFFFVKKHVFFKKTKAKKKRFTSLVQTTAYGRDLFFFFFAPHLISGGKLGIYGRDDLQKTCPPFVQ